MSLRERVWQHRHPEGEQNSERIKKKKEIPEKSTEICSKKEGKIMKPSRASYMQS